MVDSVFKYRILKDKNLIITYYSGQFPFSEIYNCYQLLGNDIDYLPTMSVLNDVRDALFLLDNNLLMDFLDNMKRNTKIYNQRKAVILTNSPNQVVFGKLVEMFKAESLIDLNIVSTLKESFKRLDVNAKDYILVENTLDYLRSG